MSKVQIVLIIIGITFLSLVGILVKTAVFDSRTTLLTVVGEGKVKADPEIAQFTISFLANGFSATDALEGEKIFRERMVTLLTGLYGVEQSDLQVSYPRIVSSNTTGNLSYQAVNTIDVKFKKLPSLDTAINKLYQTGGNNISIANLIYTTSDSRALEDQAINEAIKDGMVRAKNMAEGAGKKLGKLVSVTGQQTQAVGTLTTEAKRSTRTSEATNEISPGQIEIIRNVSLVYELK